MCVVTGPDYGKRLGTFPESPTECGRLAHGSNDGAPAHVEQFNAFESRELLLECTPGVRILLAGDRRPDRHV
jgi:hypothetical protein